MLTFKDGSLVQTLVSAISLLPTSAVLKIDQLVNRLVLSFDPKAFQGIKQALQKSTQLSLGLMQKPDLIRSHLLPHVLKPLVLHFLTKAPEFTKVFHSMMESLLNNALDMPEDLVVVLRELHANYEATSQDP